MGKFKRPRRGRASGASEDALFLGALLGESSSSDQRKFNPSEDRKTLQLCRQVQRALSLALAGDCADDLLRDVYVDSVLPMGGPGQLLVRVLAPAEAGAPLADITARLAALTPRLRAIVAGEICRKRVPTLSFVVVPSLAAADDPEEGDRHDD